MTRDLSHADLIIKIALAVVVILLRAFGIISGRVADALLVLAILVLVYYVVRILFIWMIRD